MSFGMLTVHNPKDIPLLMRRLAANYRGTAEHPVNLAAWKDRGGYEAGHSEADIWLYAAQLLNYSAKELEEMIASIRKPRERMALDLAKLPRSRERIER